MRTRYLFACSSAVVDRPLNLPASCMRRVSKIRSLMCVAAMVCAALGLTAAHAQETGTSDAARSVGATRRGGSPPGNGVGDPNCAAPNSYVALVHGALVCQPRFNVNGDGTLTDNQTGLMWELETSACKGEVTCVTDKYTWTAGDRDRTGTLYTKFLATLNADVSASGHTSCFANHCDWRIPSSVELQTIAEPDSPTCGGGPPCIDAAFGPTQAYYYWSATTRADDPTIAWVLNFGVGDIAIGGKPLELYARAVRGGP